MHSQCAILLFAAVHAALPLLSCSKRLKAKVDAQLPRWFSGSIVLDGRSHGKQCFSEVSHGSGESGSHCIPEPPERCADDAVAFAVCVRETTSLSFRWSLHVGGARCDAGLQR